jgi:hypothetical protein
MRERRKWTAEEDAILRRGTSLQSKSTKASSNQHSHSQVQTGQLKQWNVVAAKLDGRTNKDCRKRWAKLDNNVKKGAWSVAEDEKLQAAVQQLGCKHICSMPQPAAFIINGQLTGGLRLRS